MGALFLVAACRKYLRIRARKLHNLPKGAEELGMDPGPGHLIGHQRARRGVQTARFGHMVRLEPLGDTL